MADTDPTPHQVQKFAKDVLEYYSKVAPTSKQPLAFVETCETFLKEYEAWAKIQRDKETGKHLDAEALKQEQDLFQKMQPSMNMITQEHGVIQSIMAEMKTVKKNLQESLAGMQERLLKKRRAILASYPDAEAKPAFFVAGVQRWRDTPMGKAEAEALGHVSSSFMAQFFISLLVAYKARWGNADREQYDDLTAAAMKWNRDYPDREKLAVWHDDNGNVWIRAVDRSTGQYTKPPEGLGEYMNQAFRDRGSERELAFTTETPEDVLQLNQGPATPTAEEEKKDDASAAPASAMNKKPARPQEEPSAAPHA